MINERPLSKQQISYPPYVRFLSGQQIEKFKLPLLLTILHIPLGLLMYRIGALATLHQLGILSLGLYWAVQKKIRIEKIAGLVVYLTGAEVLWRMAQSSFFWEFGKYAAAMIMVIALIRRGYTKIPALPLIYFIFLIPACILTLLTSSLSDARDDLSFNMSGPFLLFVSCWFFSHLKVSLGQLKNILFMVIIPLTSVAATTLFFTVTIEEINFTTESNFTTSGGFGPNQVSSMLGLGVFVCALCYLIFKNNTRESIYLGIIILLFTMQSVMTFSRGGIYNAVGAILVVIFFQMRNLSKGVKKILPVAIIGGIFFLMIFPYLNNFTGGKLEERFEETETTHRGDIIEADFLVFLENPVLGIGVGKAPEARAAFFDRARANHTEFTRIISEHGIFGIVSLIALSMACINNLRQHNSTIGKALVSGVIIWSALFMTNAAMRLSAPSIMWGISFITIMSVPARRNNKRKIIPKNNNISKQY